MTDFILKKNKKSIYWKGDRFIRNDHIHLSIADVQTFFFPKNFLPFFLSRKKEKTISLSRIKSCIHMLSFQGSETDYNVHHFVVPRFYHTNCLHGSFSHCGITVRNQESEERNVLAGLRMDIPSMVI